MSSIRVYPNHFIFFCKFIWYPNNFLPDISMFFHILFYYSPDALKPCIINSGLLSSIFIDIANRGSSSKHQFPDFNFSNTVDMCTFFAATVADFFYDTHASLNSVKNVKIKFYRHFKCKLK